MAIETNELIDIQTLSPFKKFIMTIGNIPTSYLESMTYAELLMWFCNYLQETVIPTVNNNGEAVEELQTLYQQLHDYVEHYFDNLDVQQEINNKLNTMALDGTLGQIVGAYIDPLIEAQNEEITNFKNTVNGQITTLNNKITSATTLDPLVASSTSGMTDTSKIYLNTSDGYWYYYNGSTWVQGGVYQTNADTNNIEILENMMLPINETLKCIWENKSVYWNTGTQRIVVENSQYRLAFTTPVTAPRDIFIRTNEGYKYSVNIYNDEEDEITTSYDATWSYYVLRKIPQGTKFTIVLSRSDNGVITPTEASNLISLSYLNNIDSKLVEQLAYYGLIINYNLFNLYNIYAKNDGTYQHEYSQHNRATTSEPQINLFNTPVKAKAGYQFSLLMLNPEDTTKITQDIGWQTSYTIPAGLPYLIKIAKINNANLTWDDVQCIYVDHNYLTNDSITPLIDYDKNVKGIAHRGFSSIAPENTIPAFKMAKEVGFNYVECDVQFTSDNVPVLLHDLSINRTGRNADGTTISKTININDITYAEALDYDFGIWKGSSYAGTKIPTFENFIKFCKKAELHPYIEIKSDVVYSESQVQALLSIVKQCGMQDNVTWISFRGGYLTTVKNTYDKARIGFVMSDIVDEYLTLAQTFKTGKNEVFIDLYTGNVNSTNVTKLINNDFPLEVWIYDNSSDIINMNPYISGVTSNTQIAGKVLRDNALS